MALLSSLTRLRGFRHLFNNRIEGLLYCMETKPLDALPRGAGTGIRLNLGKAIKSIRYEMEISQEELAGRAGLHRTYISDIERGSRNPSLESIEKLALALGISMPLLFERVTNQGGGNGVSFQHKAEIISAKRT